VQRCKNIIFLKILYFKNDLITNYEIIKMIIKIDIRENDLLQEIKQLIINIPLFKNIVIQRETLPIGDIIIEDNQNEKIIIERKTVADLLASIKDGRYEEQSFRLNGSNIHNHNIIYLIEGEFNRVNRFKSDNSLSTEKLTLYSAVFSLNYYKGFSVFRSFSLAETAIIICNMAYKIQKETKKEFYQNQNATENNQNENKKTENDEEKNIEKENDEEKNLEKEYINVVKKVKKENITPDNIGEIMLSQIPGISSVTALTIMEKFKTISNLIKELETNSDCLKDICSINKKGQSRKINKTSISNIVKFLLKK
jgi:ERCC4-type nuclease